LLETAHHHAVFMARTIEQPGWTSQFRALQFSIGAILCDLRPDGEAGANVLDPVDYGPAQALGEALRAAGADGIVYPSVRDPEGECAALFHPDLTGEPVQTRHLDYHWDGERVDLYRDAGSGEVYRIVP
jgi:hypothetical protein